MRISELLDLVGEHAGELGGDEGIEAGSPDVDVRGVLVCFMATADALRRARSEECNLVISHEALLLPYKGLHGFSEQVHDWSANRARLEQVDRGGLTVLRLHCSLDKWLLYDAFREILGLPAEAERGGFHRIYPVDPAPLDHWIQRAKTATGVEHVRIVGDPESTVTRIGLPLGGLPLYTNISFVESLIAGGADLLIGGESDDYALRYMSDAGVCFIETGHSASENPGLAKFADILRSAFPKPKVVFHQVPVPHDWA